jgi:hypothetical protein
VEYRPDEAIDYDEETMEFTYETRWTCPECYVKCDTKYPVKCSDCQFFRLEHTHKEGSELRDIGICEIYEKMEKVIYVNRRGYIYAWINRDCREFIDENGKHPNPNYTQFVVEYKFVVKRLNSMEFDFMVEKDGKEVFFTRDRCFSATKDDFDINEIYKGGIRFMLEELSKYPEWKAKEEQK